MSSVRILTQLASDPFPAQQRATGTHKTCNPLLLCTL